MRLQLLTLSAACAAACSTALAQERVTFGSLDGETTLNAYLSPPQQTGPRPALVFLHGCSGMRRPNGAILPIYREWRRELVGHGYVVLVVDSAGSRGFGATCTASTARRTVLRNRPKDVYAALQFLQAQPNVRSDRVGVIGWSQGGQTVLRAIGVQSQGRPDRLKQDFAAAAAFYPGGCSERLQSRPFVPAEPNTWTTKIPLLVLFGAADNWTPIGPCEEFIAGAKARGAPITFHRYPEALHGFDAPNLSRRALPHFRMQDGTVPQVGTDQAARADALVRVPEFLRRHLLAGE
jgi:dienelactone hydrolase